MGLSLLLQGCAVIAAQVCAGGWLLRLCFGHGDPRGSWPLQAACSLILGAAILCVEAIALGALVGAYSFGLVVVPWLVIGVLSWLWRWRAGTAQIRFGALAWAGGAGVLGAFAFRFSRPTITGDPASNFAAFGRLFAHLGRVDPGAAAGISHYGHFEYPPLVAVNESLFYQLNEAFGAHLLLLQFAAYGLVLLGLGWHVLVNSTQGRARLVGVGLLALLMIQPSTVMLSTRGFGDLPFVCGLLWLLIEFFGLGRTRTGGMRDIWALLLPGAVLAITKNEGIAIACGLALVQLIRMGRRWILPALGLVVTASLWPLWIRSLNLESEWVAGASESFSLDKLERLPRSAGALFEQVFLFGNYPIWSISTFALAAVVVMALLARRGIRGFALVLTGLGLHFALYTIVFCLTSSEFEWHLSTASHRLAYHFIPYFVVGAGLCLRAAASGGASDLLEQSRDLHGDSASLG